MAESITVQATINAPIQKVWEYYNSAEHINKWSSPDHKVSKTTVQENGLRAGGKFVFIMEALDGSWKFPFGGTYDEVVENSLLKYTLGDGRKATVAMTEENGQTKVDVTFELETVNTPEKQREGWQAILDNFKNYMEGQV